ncbi:MAG: contractile injection system tape measure protein, partial [Pseudomonadota bacterium]
TPVHRRIEPTAQEREVIEGLLAAMIEHWQVVGKTSVEGLREAFLQREGALRHHDEGWQLQVDQRAYDMLLDRLPWSFTPLRLPWMDEVLQVQWR